MTRVEEASRSLHVEITHPFHPKRGTRFALVTRRQNWAERRVMFFDAQRRLRLILESWTNLAEDAFTQASAGSSWFRPDDLMQRSVLISDVERREAS